MDTSHTLSPRLELSIHGFDPELAGAMEKELERQERNIELIASENYVSPHVLAAHGSVLTNKYAEGYPARRYYGGCEFVDIAESLAIERARRLFGCEYANVQPHSGSQANMAAFLALAQPGDTILGMSLDHGGHLTHGAAPNFSGKLFRAVQYGVRLSDERIDYDEVRSLARSHRPAIITAGFSAYSRFVDWAVFREICDEVGAALVVDMAHVAGLVATGLYPDPLPHAHLVTSTTHKTLRGPRGGLILAQRDSDLTRRVDSWIFPGIQGGPLMQVVAAKAVAFAEALEPAFETYQRQVVANARTMAETITGRGYRVVSEGTDNHLMVVDLRGTAITGAQASQALERVGITLNKNTVPGDPQPPTVCSGIRLGTPAITTRGFGEIQAEWLAHRLCDVLDAPDDRALGDAVRGEISELCARFAVYPDAASETVATSAPGQVGQ